MTQHLDQGAFNWHKASASASKDDCVEQGNRPDGTVAVRDTKAKGTGHILGFTADAWTSFVKDLKSDDCLTGGLL
jgi:Domain of unknown function (DUF397)